MRDYRDCAVCGSKVFRTWVASDPPAVQCDFCGFIWINPCEVDTGFYHNYTRRDGDKERAAHRRIQYQLDKQFLSLFIPRKWHKDGAKVLDIGCSDGVFLSCLSDRFEKYGLDIDADAIKKCRNIEAFAGALENQPWPRGYFNIIVMRGVIEHFPYPEREMGIVADLLSADGLLYIAATPDVDSFCANIYRDKWRLFDTVKHVSCFSLRTLVEFMAKYDLAYIAHQHPYLETPYADKVKDYEAVWQACRGDLSESRAFWGNMMNVVFKR